MESGDKVLKSIWTTHTWYVLTLNYFSPWYSIVIPNGMYWKFNDFCEK